LITISNGLVEVSQNVDMGPGTLTVGSGSLVVTCTNGANSSIQIGGYSGAGNLNINGGFMSCTNSPILLGCLASGTAGSLTLSNGTMNCGPMFAGGEGTGTLRVAGGTMNISGQVILGYTIGGYSNPGILLASGGTLNIANAAGNNRLSVGGGIVTSVSGTNVYTYGVAGPGALTIGGGRL
jgi:hypothetical protein